MDKLLGEGAFSFVHMGISMSGSRFALKKMIPQSTEMDTNAQVEIESLRRFKHENILECVDHKYLLEGGNKVVYLLFPFISRGTLRDQLNCGVLVAGEKPALLDLFASFCSISKAFQVLHNYDPSFVHRDIKPEVTSPKPFANPQSNSRSNPNDNPYHD